MGLIQQVNTLAGLLPAVSNSYGTKTALIIENEETTYQELDSQSNRIANAMVRDGVLPGDRVALLGKDSLDSVRVLFGAAKCKAVFVNTNWRLADEEIVYILRDAAPKILFVDLEFARILPKISESFATTPKIVVLSDSPTEHVSFTDWCDPEDGSAPGLDHRPDDVVAQIYTSGTTGHPKGVRLPSSSFFAIVREMEAVGDPWIGWTDATVSLLCVPTFHVAGLWQLVRGLAQGSTNILMRNFDPAAILRIIPQHRVTITGMVPAMIQVVLAEPGCMSVDFSSLETLVYGGSPISRELLERGMATLGCDFCQIYGMTETGNMAVCMRPEDHREADAKRLRAAGRPLPGVEVLIQDLYGNNVSTGEVGEISIKSPARMIGYWNLPEATQETLVDGWVRTGDAGYKDEAGFIYVCDRIKDMIISAGENIYPVEIENVIRTHVSVADVAVIGVPDDLWGEAVKALVVRKPGSDVHTTDIIRYTRAHLAECKVPKSIEFVHQLPRNASGKILKMNLRGPYWENRQRQIN